MSADAQSATTALWAQDGSSESVAAILNKIQTTDNYMFALQLGLQEIVNLAGAERGVLLIRPHDGDEIYPLVIYSGEPASSAHTIEPATLFDNWALSWSNVEPADWFSLKLETFGNVVGAIYLDQNRDFEAMPGQKRAAVEILIHQLALILVFIRENSKLLQIAKERETLLQMLSTVGQIDQRLNANLDERQILLELQETGQFLLNAKWCLIWRVNRDTDSLNLWEGTAVAGDRAASRGGGGRTNTSAGR
ncbi:MAG: hypothetical protein ACE5G8_03115, partial [Anaerolineae bacterium]